AIQLVKSIFPQGLGAKIVTAHEQPTALLFSETQSRYLITVKPEDQDAFEAIIPEAKQIGLVTEEDRLSIQVNEEVLINEIPSELYNIWQGAIPEHFNES